MRAHAPKWWYRAVALVPQIPLPWLIPSPWNTEKAQWWMNKIPAKCPFERQVWVRGVLVLYIPALCPLNPFSTQLYAIRQEAQEFLYNQRPDVV